MTEPESKPLVVDEPSMKIDALLTDGVIRRGERAALASLRELVDKLVRARLGSATTECEPEIASAIFDECIQEITRELRGWANSDASISWLWMLRRLPRRVFEGNLATTIGYDQTLAEVVSGHSSATLSSSHIVNDVSLAYTINEAVIVRLARFCSGIRFLSDLHRCYRWAGKGARFQFRKKQQPVELVESETRAAVDTYDQRVARSGRPMTRLGSMMTSTIGFDPGHALLWVQAIEPTTMPTLMPGAKFVNAQEKDWVSATANYVFSLVGLEELEKLASDSRSHLDIIFTKETASLIYLLACAPTMLLRHRAGFYSLARTGYLMWTIPEAPLQFMEALYPTVLPFVRAILEAVSIQNVSEINAVVSSIVGREWPLAAGPIFRRDKNFVCVDLAAATSRLNAALQFPAVQDRYANARADHFEDQVQAVIDRSDWKPGPSTIALRRRTLICHGAPITDIDAIGERDGFLLLISCKSIVYSDRHDKGEYAAIRNAASDMQKYVKRWESVIENLERNPHGDNYDLRSFKRFVGVVCTPQVVFVHRETLDRKALPNLFFVSSIGELADWIGAPLNFWGATASISPASRGP